MEYWEKMNDIGIVDIVTPIYRVFFQNQLLDNCEVPIFTKNQNFGLLNLDKWKFNLLKIGPFKLAQTATLS